MTTFYYFFACLAASCAMYIVLTAPSPITERAS
jgi:hypothetical protein